MSKRHRTGAESRDKHGRCRHHITPRCRYRQEGTEIDNSDSNLLLLKLQRHFWWHQLWGSRSLEEVIELLLRVHRAKGRCISEKMGLPCRLTLGCHVRPKSQNGNGTSQAHRNNGHSRKDQGTPSRNAKNQRVLTAVQPSNRRGGRMG